MEPLLEGAQDDPWYWDVPRVIKEFCSTDRGWFDKNHQSRNLSFETLASNLKEHDVNGELLLTAEGHILDELVVGLVGNSFQQRSRVFRVIKSLKERSHRYQEWEKWGDVPGAAQQPPSPKRTQASSSGLPSTNSREVSQRGDDNPSLHEAILRQTPPVPQAPVPRPLGQNLSLSAFRRIVDPSVSHKTAEYLPPQIASSQEIRLTGVGSPSAGHRGLPPVAGTKRSFGVASARMDSPIPSIETAEEEPLEAPRKKRRLAPTIASPSAIVRQEAFNLPDEVDGFSLDPNTLTFTDPKDGTSKRQEVLFLGLKRVRWEDALGQPTDGLAIEDNFSIIRVKPIVAHSRRMNRSMRALLRPHPRGLKKLARTCIQPPDPDSFLSTVLRLSGVQQDEVSGTRSDPILAPYGEEDGDEDWDPQTLREMEEENAERERAAARQLPRELVDKIIDEAISEFVSLWKARKLDRLMKKAHNIWKKEQRSPNSQLNPTQARLAQIDARIAILREELIDVGWTSESALRRQALSLEQSVENREEAVYILDILAGPEPEQRPELLVRPKRDKPRPLPRPSQSDEEILTSDEEEPLSNFIDDDIRTPMRDLREATREMEDDTARISLGDNHKAAAVTAPLSEPMDTSGDDAPSGPDNGEAPELMDVDSQAPNPAEVIDLTVDSSDNDLPSPSSPDFPGISGLLDNDPHAEIDDTSANRAGLTALPTSFWDSIPADMTLTDNDRLLINRLWRLTTVTRNKLHEQAEASKDDLNDFWDKTIAEGLKHTVAVKTLPGLMTRLFINWYDMSSFAVYRLDQARKNPGEVRGKRDTIAGFHAILLRVIPLFPRLVNMPGGQGESTQQEVAMDAQAMRMRELETERAAKLEKRRQELRSTLSTLTPMATDQSRLIVNEAKEDAEGFIYIPGTPARLIKDHQIDGVRFLWNQIVVAPDSRHGCLIAHAMGLGKTMQVITLLLCIITSSNSPDPTVRSQIPYDLRQSRTVVLCPPSLAPNWRDEFLLWDTDKALGDVYIVTGGSSNTSTAESRMFRKNTVERWASGGGILILGYQLFTAFMKNSQDLMEIIHKRAAIVVADEAHMIKNLQSQLRKACIPFVTRARIALTGSPLANSVSEYYSMVDWAAPGYMGPSSEFADVYTRPIETGLWKDSGDTEKRTARIRLRALRENISPKVHRLDITVLKDELPRKMEFVIFVPPTPFQRSLYDQYVCELRETGLLKTCAWGALGHLSLICAHPRCFLQKVRDVLADQSVDSNPPTEDEAPETTRKNQGTEAAVALPKRVSERLIALAASEADTNRPDLSWRFRHLMAILDECRTAGDKVLIFSRRIKVLDFVEELCRRQGRRSMRLDGDTPVGTRTSLIKDFNSSTNSVEIFLISTRAGGVGLNIYGANRVVMLDFEHNPAHEQQAIGRAYRIGQTKPVFVYWFVVWGTHEAKLHGRMVFKNQLAQRVVDNKDNIQAYSASSVAQWVRQVWDVDPKIPLPESQAQALIGTDRVLDRILNDQEFSQGILSVVPTDTFEVEDPENIELTEVDLEEVQRLVSLATKRRTRKQTSDTGTESGGGGGAGSAPTGERVGAQQQPTMSSRTAQPNNGQQFQMDPASEMHIDEMVGLQREGTAQNSGTNSNIQKSSTAPPTVQPITPQPVGTAPQAYRNQGQPTRSMSVGTPQPYNQARPPPAGTTPQSYQNRGQPIPSQSVGTPQPHNYGPQTTSTGATPPSNSRGQPMPFQPMGATQPYNHQAQPPPMGAVPPSNGRGQPASSKSVGNPHSYHQAQPTPVGATPQAYHSGRGQPTPSKPVGTSHSYNHQAQSTSMRAMPPSSSGGQPMPRQSVGNTQGRGGSPTSIIHPKEAFARLVQHDAIHSSVPHHQLGRGILPKPLPTFQALQFIFGHERAERAVAEREVAERASERPATQLPPVRQQTSFPPMLPQGPAVHLPSPDPFPPIHELLRQAAGVPHTSSCEGQLPSTAMREMDPQVRPPHTNTPGSGTQGPQNNGHRS